MKTNQFFRGVLLITSLCFLIVPNYVFGQDFTFSEAISRQKTVLEVTSEVAEIVYCSSSDLELTTSITIKNVSETPQVFCKNCFFVGGTYIAKNAELLDQSKYEYDIFSPGSGWKPSNLADTWPTQEQFIILKTGESFTTKVTDFLFNFSKESRTLLPPKEYVLAQVVHPWTDSPQIANDLSKQWKYYEVNFWIKPLATPPIKFVIQKNPDFKKCN